MRHAPMVQPLPRAALCCCELCGRLRERWLMVLSEHGLFCSYSCQRRDALELPARPPKDRARVESPLSRRRE